MKKIFLVVASLASILATSRADAGEIQLDGAGTAVASTWRGDFGGGGQLRLGYRFAKIIAIDFIGWEELVSVDKRMDTGLTLGVSGFLPIGDVRPSARVYVIHQHEEGLVSVEDHAGGTVLGIGPGIRHRAGLGGSLGVEVVLARSKHTEYLFVGDASATWFPDSTLGPSAYFGIAAGLGFNYAIPGMP